MNEKKSPQEWMNASIDRFISQDDQVQLDRHLAENPEDAARYHAYKVQAQAISKAVPVADEAFLRSVGSKIERQGQRPHIWYIAAAFALFFGGGIVGYNMNTPHMADKTQVFVSEARAAHILYAPEILHPVEVEAAREEHLEKWLSNRLGAPLYVPELKALGFELVGGRLLSIDGGAAGFFMYQDTTGNRVSLVMTPAGDSRETAFRFDNTHEVTAVSWQASHWRYSLVGALEVDPMEALATAIVAQYT